MAPPILAGAYFHLAGRVKVDDLHILFSMGHEHCQNGCNLNVFHFPGLPSKRVPADTTEQDQSYARPSCARPSITPKLRNHHSSLYFFSPHLSTLSRSIYTMTDADPQQETPPYGTNHSTPTRPPSPPPDSLISPTASLDYWTHTPASITGMLGGYPQISQTDLRGSRSFLTKLRRGPSGSFTPSSHKRLKLGVDCGAGIGRVTDGFLRHVCERVDVVEPIAKFADVVRAESRAAAEGRVGRVWVCGLEGWPPLTAGVEGGRHGEGQRGERETMEMKKEKYDLIWNQWCLGHLTDSQLTAYLRRCVHILTPGPDPESDSNCNGAGEARGGWIVVKENMSTDPSGADIYDELDSSVTRTDDKFRRLFAEAGLEVVRSELQTGFPKGLGLYPVRMYGLRPEKERWRESHAS